MPPSAAGNLGSGQPALPPETQLLLPQGQWGYPVLLRVRGVLSAGHGTSMEAPGSERPGAKTPLGSISSSPPRTITCLHIPLGAGHHGCPCSCSPHRCW